MRRKQFIKTMITGAVALYGSSALGMSIDPFLSLIAQKQTKINIIGVGDGGCKMVHQAAQDRTDDVRYTAVDDRQRNLVSLEVDQSFCLVPSSGSGNISNLRVSRSLVAGQTRRISKIIGKPGFLFVASDFCWGYETSTALSIVEIAASQGICTIVFAITPARFEGVFRQVLSHSSLEWLERIESDFDVSSMVYSRETLFEENKNQFCPSCSLEDKFDITYCEVGKDLIHMVDIYKHFFRGNG